MTLGHKAILWRLNEIHDDDDDDDERRESVEDAFLNANANEKHQMM